MDFDDDTLNSSSEVGSDELLADDNLRLPESASMLVRVHAVRAWLARRQEETASEVGEAVLALQHMVSPEELQGIRLRRRERQSYEERIHSLQEVLTEAQQRLSAYEEAQSLLEDCIVHTSGERVLVEYYLMLEELMHDSTQGNASGQLPRLRALADVQHRVEHVGAPNEE